MYSADENIKFQRQTGTFAPLDPTSIDRATLLRKVSKDSVDFANLRAFTSSESNDLTSTEATITCFNYGSSLGLDTDEDRAVASCAAVNSPQPEHWSTRTLTGSLTSAQSKAIPFRPAVFRGRDEELERLVTHTLAPSKAPLGIVGPAGIGKTLLALKLLHDPRVQQHFGRQRYFLKCEGATTTDEILALLAVELQVQRLKNTPLLQTVTDHLISRQCILLVLDHIESIPSPIPEAAVTFLSQLAVLDEVTILITTCGNHLPESFTWANATTAELDTLSLTAARRTFADLSSLEPSLLEPGPEANALTELLHKIECMPLAINLLARLNELPSILLREWSKHATDALGLERHNGIRRELSVKVSIKISLAHLPAETTEVPTRQLLFVLGQLPAGLFSNVSNELRSAIPHLDAAAQVLLNHSLVFIGEHGELGMLSPVRRHAPASLPMFSTTLSAVDKIYLGISRAIPAPTHIGVDRSAYASELPNILSILTSALGRRCDRQLVMTIIRFALFHHHHHSCLQLLQKLLTCLSDRSKERAECLRAIADQYQGIGDPQIGIPFLEQAADLFAELKDKASEAVSRERLALILTALGQQKDADRLAARVQPLPREISDFSYQALPVPGESALISEQRFRDAREARRRARDGPTVSALSDLILQSILNRGDVAAYTRELEFSVTLGAQIRPGTVWLAATQLQLAEQYLSCNNMDGAEGLLVEACAALSHPGNSRTGLATATLLFATLREAQSRFSEGAALFETACRLFQECDNSAKAAWCDREADRMWIRAATNK